jgi:hypothetical protein
VKEINLMNQYVLSPWSGTNWLPLIIILLLLAFVIVTFFWPRRGKSQHYVGFGREVIDIPKDIPYYADHDQLIEEVYFLKEEIEQLKKVER